MKYFLIVFLIHYLPVIILAAKGVIFSRIDVSSLDVLKKAATETTEILISDSKIPYVPGDIFARFGPTLVTLDMHESGIETIHGNAFANLTRLENLILWGNKLQWVSYEWFRYTSNLRTLDLSFNFIGRMDYVLQMLPYLENFYCDYNRLEFIDFDMIPNLRNLRRVKFGKNPLRWPYRARLTWQLESQRIEYTQEWEDWGWMSVVIKDCIESGYGELPSDTVLDCTIGKLLDFTYDTLPEDMKHHSGICNYEARRLVQCSRPRNGTGNTDNETMRRILMNYAAVLMPMSRSESSFSNAIRNPRI